MGGHHEVKPHAKRAVPAAFQRPDAQALLDKSRPYAVCEDWMLRYKALDAMRMWRLFELFAIFWAPVRRHLCDPTTACLLYIMVADDKRLVPHYKRQTQTKRAVQASQSHAKKGIAPAEAYPPGIRFDADGGGGVVMPDDERDLIDLRRLALSTRGSWSRGPLSLDLYRAFFPLIVAAMRRVPDGRYFVFDFEHEGPVWFNNRGAFYQVRAQAHLLGEADLALFWWIERLRASPLPPTQIMSPATTPATVEAASRNRPVVAHVYTRDTDFLPMWLLYHERFVSGERTLASVVWHPEPLSTDQEWVDMALLGEGVKASLHLETREYALAIMLAGNDYIDKRLHAHYFNFDKIVEAVREADLPRTLPLLFGPNAATTHQMLGLVLLLLYNIEHRRSGGDYCVPAAHRKPLALLSWAALRRHFQGKQHKVASDEQLAQTVADFEFNLPYWLGAADAVRHDLTDEQKAMVRAAAAAAAQAAVPIEL